MTAATGAEALQQLTAAQPQLVLLDLRLPDLHGLEVLRQIKRRDQAVPVIVITALRDEAVGREALSAGAADFVTKPVNLQYLAWRMAALLGPSLGPTDRPPRGGGAPGDPRTA